MRRMVVISILLLSGIGALSHSDAAGLGTRATISPVNTQASATAGKVLQYLFQLSDSTFNGVVSGQNCGHGNEIVTKYPAYFDTMHRTTGQYIGVVGIDYEYIKDYTAQELHQANMKLIEHWRRGGFVTINMSARCPWGDHSVYYRGTDIDLQKLTTVGTTENQYWMQKLDRIAAGLRELRDSGVVVLWRPMQEMDAGQDGGSFWWSRNRTVNTAERYIAVWRHLFTYFTQQKGLDNLLWVYSPLGGSGWGYPGEQYVDVIAGTSYNADLTLWPYLDWVRLAAGKKAIGVAEYGSAIDNSPGTFDTRNYVNTILARYPRIAYWVSWHSWDGANKMALVDNRYRSELMNNPAVINVGEIPIRSTGLAINGHFSLDTGPESVRQQPSDNPGLSGSFSFDPAGRVGIRQFRGPMVRFRSTAGGRWAGRMRLAADHPARAD